MTSSGERWSSSSDDLKRQVPNVCATEQDLHFVALSPWGQVALPVHLNKGQQVGQLGRHVQHMV